MHQTVCEMPDAEVDDWIPANDPPKIGGLYLVTLQGNSGARIVRAAGYSDGCWTYTAPDFKVVAWQPLPRPFKGS